MFRDRSRRRFVPISAIISRARTDVLRNVISDRDKLKLPPFIYRGCTSDVAFPKCLHFSPQTAFFAPRFPCLTNRTETAFRVRE